MANNLVVQLLLKTGTFSSDLKTAKGQIQSFQKGCQTAGKSLSAFGNAIGIDVGALAKFGGAVGLAVAAGKEFKAVIDSSQGTADSFQGTLAGCKGVLDSFNTSLATADFSAFGNGLWEVYDAAKAVQEALDQLGNTQIAYDYKSKQNMTKFQEAYNIFKDSNSTPKQKEEAKKSMQKAIDDQFTFARNYSNQLYKTYVAKVVKKAGNSNLLASRVTIAQFEKAMNIDLGLNGDPEKAREENEKQYKQYRAKLKEYGKNNIVAQDNLKKRYADVIAIHAMLELMKDDELQGVAQLIGGMEDAKQVALSMQKTFNRATAPQKTGTGKGKSTKKNDFVPGKDSLLYWQDILSEETKARDAVVMGTDAWNQHNEKVVEAEQKIKNIKDAMAGVVEEEEFSITYVKKVLAEATQLRDELELGSDEWIKQNEKVQNLQEVLNDMEMMVSHLDLDAALSVNPPTIESLQTALSILTTMRNQVAIDSEEFKELSDWIAKLQQKINGLNGVTSATDQWDSFNQAMANTSTIVSSLTSTFREGAEVTAASILQMVATALPAIGSLISSISALTSVEAVEAGVAATGKAVSTSKHWIEAIAAVASLGAVVAAAIQSAKSQKFANGGIVGGSSFTGDRVTASVNSGEMILNRSQQANLFRMANGSGSGGQVEFHISGTELVGVLNNNTKKNRVIR